MACQRSKGQDEPQRGSRLKHPWFMRAEGEVLRFPAENVEAWANFDVLFEEEHERLFKALYFVTGNRHGRRTPRRHHDASNRPAAGEEQHNPPLRQPRSCGPVTKRCRKL